MIQEKVKLIQMKPNIVVVDMGLFVDLRVLELPDTTETLVSGFHCFVSTPFFDQR